MHKLNLRNENKYSLFYLHRRFIKYVICICLGFLKLIIFILRVQQLTH